MVMEMNITFREEEKNIQKSVMKLKSLTRLKDRIALVSAMLAGRQKKKKLLY